MSGNDQAHIEEHIKVYLTVFGALAVLTILTVSASYLEVSNTEAIFFALTIATIKASLVAGYFMHLITEKQRIVWILILTFFFFLKSMVEEIENACNRSTVVFPNDIFIF